MIRLAFVIWVLAEIALFALAGRALGVWPTLGLVLLTGLAGVLVLQAQGARTLLALQGRLRSVRSPGALMLQGGFRLLAGLLLILPGFLGDVAGLLLLLPPVQRTAVASLSRAARRAGAAPGTPNRTTVFVSRGGARPPEPPPEREPADAPDVIEAEWEDLGAPPSRRPGDAPGPANSGPANSGPANSGPANPSRRPPSGWTRH